jgi:hypothetical protein
MVFRSCWLNCDTTMVPRVRTYWSFTVPLILLPGQLAPQGASVGLPCMIVLFVVRS